MIKKIAKKNIQGFSLLEVLIAVSILAIVLITFIKLNTFNLMSFNKSSNLTKLLFLSKQKMSELEIDEYPELGVKSGEFENQPGYKWTETANDFGIDGVRKVEITVTSPDGEKNSVLIYKAKP